MSEAWKQWEGQVVNGEFPLLAYLGGSRHSAVFVTRPKSGTPERAVIKLISADPGNPESQLQRWKKSAELTHPNLVRIFSSGRCEIDNALLLYVVMDAAEEDLSQILPERALSPDEMRQLLPSVLDALEHVHGKGLVHGRLRPSNILASGDQVKVSADTLRVSGERVPSPDVWSAYDPPEGSGERLTTAADVWSLAVTMVQALTQQRPLFHPAEPAAPSLPENTPEPFREIARRCLQVDPQQRCTLADIRAALQTKVSRPAAGAGPKPPARAASETQDRKSTPWMWLVGLVAAIVVIALIVLAGNGRRKSVGPSEEGHSQDAGSARNSIPESSATPAATKISAASHEKKSSGNQSSGRPRQEAKGKGAVLQQVMPQPSPSARRTIDGKIKVGVRVDVDPAGNVTEATLVSPGPSKYFARLAVEAARQWKFTPPEEQGQPVASQWMLRFGYRRTSTDAVSTQVLPK